MKNALNSKFSLLATFLSFLVGLTNCSTSLPLEEPNSSDYLPLAPTEQRVTNETTLKAGDQVEIFVTEDSTFNGTYVIRGEGHIIFPTFGRFQLAGLRPKEAEQKLKQELQKGKLRVATVILDRLIEVIPPEKDLKNKLVVYLTGKVVQPGQHTLTTLAGQPLGVYEAIMISGGFARYAEPRKSYIVRTALESGGKRRLSLNLQDIIEGKKPDMPIHPGDVVVVPEKVLGF